jgi:hypothetical protein
MAAAKDPRVLRKNVGNIFRYPSIVVLCYSFWFSLSFLLQCIISHTTFRNCSVEEGHHENNSKKTDTTKTDTV